MQIDGLTLKEGSRMKNAALPEGNVFPDMPDVGELFFKTGAQNGLYCYDAGGWRLVSLDGVSVSGWRDIVAEITSRGGGNTAPTWDQFVNGIYAYKFGATVLTEVWLNFHINHDYQLGTPIHLHAHWAGNAAIPSTGKVVWGFEYTIAKGHQQQAFPASTTIYVEQNQNSISKTHHVAEMSVGITSSSLEPDTLILVRLFRNGAHIEDTCTDPVFLLTADCHYIADRFATVNKAPNFYG